MDDLQKLLTAIAIIAQLGAQHAEDREMIRHLTAHIKRLTDKPIATERGVPE